MYKSRHIKFKEIISIDNWKVKTYTISLSDIFNSVITYSSAIAMLPDWLTQLNSFNANHEDVSFLILHEASEGVFVLLNTWVGNNMLQTHIFLAKHDEADRFTKISGDGLFGCVWEMEVINFERMSWLKYVLKNSENPDYQSYLDDTTSVVL